MDDLEVFVYDSGSSCIIAKANETKLTAKRRTGHQTSGMTLTNTVLVSCSCHQTSQISISLKYLVYFRTSYEFSGQLVST